MDSTSRWFRRLPDSKKAPPGLEWKIFKRLPRWFVGGLLACAVPPLVARWWYADLSPQAAEKYLNTVDILTLAALGLHLTVIFTLAFGCIIVIVMKGHAYVADGFPVPSSKEDDLADLRARQAEEERRRRGKEQ